MGPSRFARGFMLRLPLTSLTESRFRSPNFFPALTGSLFAGYQQTYTGQSAWTVYLVFFCACVQVYNSDVFLFNYSNISLFSSAYSVIAFYGVKKEKKYVAKYCRHSSF